MPDIDLKHALGIEGARAAADRMAQDLRRRFGLSGDWSGNTLRFERPGLSGSLVVAETMVHITATLGFLMKAMKPSIEKAIEGELDRLVATAPGKAARGEPAAKKPAARPKTGPKPRK
jgi:putative polyhydroxyalkanoate system protein